MLKIELTSENTFGEPGLNFVWLGSPRDFSWLIEEIREFDLSPTSRERQFGKVDNHVHLVGLDSVTLRVTVGGTDLVRVKNNDVIVNLAPILWKRILEYLNPLSTHPCHNYLDFDDQQNLREDANWIVSSEF